jgi:hypothetical protein
VSAALGTLGLAPTGTVAVTTPSTGATAATCNQYDVSLTLLHPQPCLAFNVVPIVECSSLGGGIQALLGRDLLRHCLFVYDGPAGRFSLGF